MQFQKTTSPYLHNNQSVSHVMRQVIYALIPGTLVYSYFFGWSIILNIALACLTALLSEALMLTLRKRPLAFYLRDNSAILSAWLLALALPSLSPWWLIVIATLFAIVVAKHLYGGLGYNPFNPAMVGYVVVMISFPQHMTLWLQPNAGLDFSQALQFLIQGELNSSINMDSITSATPIDTIKTGLSLNNTIAEISASPLFGHIGGTAWEWIAGAFLLGGLWLLYRGIINWQIPFSMLVSIAILAGIFYLVDPQQYSNPLFQLFSGGTILAAFFIATDPVSASTTATGRLIYAAGIGVLTFIIRTWGGYPDGIAFAVLLMNMAVPTIDYYTQPRVFGAPGK